MSYATKALIGYSIIGSMIVGGPGKAGEAVVGVLTGQYDEELKAMVFHRLSSQFPSEVDMNLPEVLAGVENIKAQLRREVQMLFELAAKEEQDDHRRKVDGILEELKVSHRPDPMGTVAEIAAKYNVSKSEVRRLKAAGQLSTLIKG